MPWRLGHCASGGAYAVLAAGVLSRIRQKTSAIGTAYAHPEAQCPSRHGTLGAEHLDFDAFFADLQQGRRQNHSTCTDAPPQLFSNKRKGAPEGAILRDIAIGSADPSHPDPQVPRPGAVAARLAIKTEMLRHWRRATDAATISANRTYNPEAPQDFALLLPTVDRTHHLLSLRNILFCDRCGYWSMRTTRMLARPCLGQPRPGQLTMLRRMCKGHHPDRATWPDGTIGMYPVYHVAHLDSEDCGTNETQHTEGPVLSD